MKFRLVTTEKTGRIVKMFALGEDGEKYLINVDDFYPYFFISEADYRMDEPFLRYKERKGEIEDIDEGYEAILDEDLVKITVDEPSTVKDIKIRYDNNDDSDGTWEANVPYTRRFMIDNDLNDFFEIDDSLISGNEIRVLSDDVSSIDDVSDWDIEETVMAYDIETETPVSSSSPQSPIISIAAKIFGDDTLHTFILAPERDFDGECDVVKTEWVDEENDGDVYEWVKRYYKEEELLLEEFCDFVSDVSPDVLAGYNNHNFDNPVTLGRMEKNGVKSHKLSPMDLFSGGRRSRIKGVINADIQQIWMFSQASETRYETLEEVADVEANYTVPKEKREELKDNFRDGNYDFIADYNNYDVVALEEINEVDWTVDSLRNYMRELGIEEYTLATETQKQLINVLYVAREDEKIPTQSREEKSGFTGGYVYPPTPGKHKYSGVFDLSKIYPTVMYDGNISYETLVRDGSDDGLEMPNGTRFRQDEQGILPRVLEHMFDMREYYEKRMDEADTHREYERWYNKRQTVKISTNSLYGVMTNSAFPLFSEDVARTITYLARQCLHKCADVLTEYGYDIIYGDTDSVFVNFGTNDPDECVSIGEWIEDIINERLIEYSKELDFERHNFEIEFESLFSRLVFKDKKKRYAGKVIWADGDFLSDERQYTMIKGFAVVRSSAAEVTQDMQSDLLDALLEDKEPLYITSLIRSYYNMTSEGLYDLEYICPYPQVKRLNYDKGNYFVFDSFVVSHFFYGIPLETGRYYYAYVEEGTATIEIDEDIGDNLEDWQGETIEMERVVFKEQEQLTDYLLKRIDYEKIADKVVYDKAKLILEPMGWGECLTAVKTADDGSTQATFGHFGGGEGASA